MTEALFAYLIIGLAGLAVVTVIDRDPKLPASATVARLIFFVIWFVMLWPWLLIWFVPEKNK